jgi:hypothetical protein
VVVGCSEGLRCVVKGDPTQLEWGGSQEGRNMLGFQSGLVGGIGKAKGEKGRVLEG